MIMADVRSRVGCVKRYWSIMDVMEESMMSQNNG